MNTFKDFLKEQRAGLGTGAQFSRGTRNPYMTGGLTQAPRVSPRGSSLSGGPRVLSQREIRAQQAKVQQQQIDRGVRAPKPIKPEPLRGPAGAGSQTRPVPAAPRAPGAVSRLGKALNSKLGRWGLLGTAAAVAWLNIDNIADAIVRFLMPGPSWLKDFLINNTLAVVAVGLGLGVFRRDIMRIPGRIRRTFKNKAIINDIKSSLELDDTEMARKILFDAMEMEGLSLGVVRDKLNASEWLELSVTIAQNRR